MPDEPGGFACHTPPDRGDLHLREKRPNVLQRRLALPPGAHELVREVGEQVLDVLLVELVVGEGDGQRQVGAQRRSEAGYLNHKV